MASLTCDLPGAPGRIRKRHPREVGGAGVDGPNPPRPLAKGPDPLRKTGPKRLVVPPGGFEPSTPALGERCSIP